MASRNGVTLQCDANGNLLQDSTRKYQYDALNRLIGVSRLDGCPVASYAYDAGNRRVRKTGMNCGISGDVPAVQLDYVYRGAQVIEERDASNTPLRQYVWGRYVDELLQQRELTTRTGDYYPLADLHHRTVALTDSTGKVQEAYDTDAYGNTLVFDCGNCVWFTDQDRKSNRPLCRYVYTGREYDPETGMYYYRTRYYDAQMGRFISRDPISYVGGMNLYGYTGGRPANAVDPSGFHEADDSGLTWQEKENVRQEREDRRRISRGEGPHFDIDPKFSSPNIVTYRDYLHAKAMATEASRQALWHGAYNNGNYKNSNWWAEQSADWNIAADDWLNPRLSAIDEFILWLGKDPSTAGSLFPVVGPFRKAVHNFDTGHPIYGSLWVVLTALDALTLGGSGKAVGAGRAAAEEGTDLAINLVPKTRIGRMVSRVQSYRQNAWWYRGAEHDAEWRSLSLTEKFFADLGQKTRLVDPGGGSIIPDAVARGRSLWNEKKMAALLSEGSGWRLGAGTTLHTGPTPAVRWFVPRAYIVGRALGPEWEEWREQ